jgi:hypothetical protein
VIAVYRATPADALAPPRIALPDDAVMTAGDPSTPGQLSAGAVGCQHVITGVFVGIDQVLHTISLVDPFADAA